MARAAVLLVVSLWVICARAASPLPASVFLEDLTWTEVRQATSAGKTTIIVPIGGTEQSGPHIALGKHNARVRYLAEKVATALGTALVAPVIAYVPEGKSSPPSGHMRFPGTITISEEAFERTLDGAARGFRLHAFKDIVFIGDHGGYQKNLRKVADTLNQEWAATSVRAHAVEEYYRAADVEFPKLLRERGFSAEEIGTHAGLADTSLALAIDPAMVRADRLQASHRQLDGVSGNPRRASAELGKAGIDLIVTRTVEAIRKATAR